MTTERTEGVGIRIIDTDTSYKYNRTDTTPVLGGSVNKSWSPLSPRSNLGGLYGHTKTETDGVSEEVYDRHDGSNGSVYHPYYTPWPLLSTRVHHYVSRRRSSLFDGP